MKSMPHKFNQKKVAIVHDWLIGGGAEQVVLELHKIFPDAPIYTSYAKKEWREKLDNKVVTGYLQKWPFSKLRKFLPLLRIYWFKSLDLSGFDLVISSSGNGEAKHVTTPDGAKHVCYCHTPPHFYWRHYKQYIETPGFGIFDPLARLGLKILIKPLRKKDLRAAKKVDLFIANSTHIQRDIKKYYGKGSVVIHPPVKVDRFKNIQKLNRKGFVTVGRQTGYKKTDLIIQACNQLGLNLTVVGNGPEHKKLVKLAGKTIKFDTTASDKDVQNYLASAEAFIFAAEEDFGITPVEAMAAGTPVIAYKAGGALDYIIPGKTGEFFTEQNLQSLVRCLNNFDHNQFNSSTIVKQSMNFQSNRFDEQLIEVINSL